MSTEGQGKPKKPPPKKPSPANRLTQTESAPAERPAPARPTAGAPGPGVGSPAPTTAPMRSGPAAKPAPPKPETLEDKILAIPYLEDLAAQQPPDIYTRFIEELGPKIALRRTSTDLLQSFSSVDVTGDKIANALRSNPYYLHYFMRVLEARSRRTSFPSLEAAVVLLGMQNSRNLIVALQALRSVQQAHPDLDDKGMPQVAPEKLLAYAIKTEESLLGDRTGYAETSFAAGLVFDLLSLVAESAGDQKSKLQTFIGQTYLHGLRSAKIGMELVKSLPDLSFKKYVFSACLLHDVGKVAMALLMPAYLDWMESVRKKGLPRKLRHVEERLRFGITHVELSGLVCHGFKLFRALEKSILHHHDPHRIRAQKHAYDLACLISLASNMANQFRKVTEPTDPMIEIWKGPELKGFKIAPKAIVGTAARINL